MTTKLHPVSAHMRRSPVDPFASIKAAKTEQLRREVEIDRELEQALRDELERDPTFAFHGGLV